MLLALWSLQFQGAAPPSKPTQGGALGWYAPHVLPSKKEEYQEVIQELNETERDLEAVNKTIETIGFDLNSTLKAKAEVAAYLAAEDLAQMQAREKAMREEIARLENVRAFLMREQDDIIAILYSLPFMA